MCQKLLICLLLLFPFHSISSELNYSFIDGDWNCLLESKLTDEIILKAEGVSTFSLIENSELSRLTVTAFLKSDLSISSILSVESKDNFTIRDGTKISTNKLNILRADVLKDDLKILTPEFIKNFKEGNGGIVHLNILKVDEDHMNLEEIKTKETTFCSRK